MDEDEVVNIFISHYHQDKDLADAISELLTETFPKRVRVTYSSSADVEHGVRPGDNWFDWILNEIKNSKIAIIALTKRSIDKPWVLWESGAVSGVGLARDPGTRVIPMTVGIGLDEIPAPQRTSNAIDGTQASDIKKLLDDVHNFVQPQVEHFDIACKAHSQKYLNKIQAFCDSIILDDRDIFQENPFVLKDWGRSLAYPLSVIKIAWKGMSNIKEGKYSEDDLKEPPWVFDGNRDLYDFYQIVRHQYDSTVKDFERHHLTFSALIERLEELVDKKYLDAFVEDQKRLQNLVIFQDTDAKPFMTAADREPSNAEAPIIFNQNHPTLANQIFLPCLIAKRHEGNFPMGPHNTYLLVAYVNVTKLIGTGAPIG